MKERKVKMEKAFESFLKEVDFDELIKFVEEEVWSIFKKIEEAAIHDQSVIKRFGALLIDVSHLRKHGTLEKFDSDKLKNIVGKLGHLLTVLQGIKVFKESKENIESWKS